MAYEDVIRNAAGYADMSIKDMELAVGCFLHAMKRNLVSYQDVVDVPDFGNFCVSFDGNQPFISFVYDSLSWQIPRKEAEDSALWVRDFHWKHMESGWLWDKSRLIHRIENQRRTLRQYEARINELLHGPGAPRPKGGVDARNCPSDASCADSRPDTRTAPENVREGL